VARIKLQRLIASTPPARAVRHPASAS